MKIENLKELLENNNLKELKNTYKSEGKYTGIINKEDRVVA